MIEQLDQPTLLVLSALAVLFGVPLAMLLWIAAQSIQMRVLRRRLGEVETTLIRLQNAGAAGAPNRIEDIDAHGLVVERAPAPIAASDAIEASDSETATEAVAQESESESETETATETSDQVVDAESAPEDANGEDNRDWLGVTDLPGIAAAAPVATAALSETLSAGETAIEEAAEEASAPDTPARRWLRQAAVEAEPVADGPVASEGETASEGGDADATDAAADAGATDTPSTWNTDATADPVADNETDEEAPA